jgi:putative transposase
MPRHARFSLAGVPMHVLQRGHNRSACFFDPSDHRYYLDRLRELSEAFGCAVHAYCLMTNHVHLLLTPPTESAAGRMMRLLAQHYSQYVNRTYERRGTIWEGRFRSSLVDSERYLLACHVYVERNPVRAGMVRLPRDYPWSSYRANAEGRVDRLLTPHPRYLALGDEPAARRAAYRHLHGAGMDEATLDEIRDATNGGFVLGNARFAAEIEAALGRRVTRGKPGRPRKRDGAAASA